MQMATKNMSRVARTGICKAITLRQANADADADADLIVIEGYDGLQA